MLLNPTMAFLKLDGRYRPTCVGCAMVLINDGMLRTVEKQWLPMASPHAIPIVLWCNEIVPPFTLADCQQAIDKRHIGPAWGE